MRKGKKRSRKIPRRCPEKAGKYTAHDWTFFPFKAKDLTFEILNYVDHPETVNGIVKRIASRKIGMATTAAHHLRSVSGIRTVGLEKGIATAVVPAMIVIETAMALVNRPGIGEADLLGMKTAVAENERETAIEVQPKITSRNLARQQRRLSPELIELMNQRATKKKTTKTGLKITRMTETVAVAIESETAPIDPKMKDRETIGQGMTDPKMKDRETTDQGMTDPKMKDRETIGQGMTDPKMKDRETTGQGMTDPKMKDRETIGQGMTDPKTIGREMIDQEMTNPKEKATGIGTGTMDATTVTAREETEVHLRTVDSMEDHLLRWIIYRQVGEEVLLHVAGHPRNSVTTVRQGQELGLLQAAAPLFGIGDETVLLDGETETRIGDRSI